jgi:thiol-disulfide isomerase/thioredoxin
MRPARVLVAVLAALALAAGCSEAGLEAEAPTVPDEGARPPAPAFSVPALDGRGQVALADYRDRPVILNFWASWCAPCRREMPELVDFARENPDIAVVGLAVSDVRADSRRFAREFDVPYDLGVDRDAKVAGEYAATGLPVTVVIDREGREASTWYGPIGRDELELFAAQLGA